MPDYTVLKMGTVWLYDWRQSGPVTIDDVIIRVSEKFSLAMHMDYDEANACSYKKGDMGYIIKKN